VLQTDVGTESVSRRRTETDVGRGGGGAGQLFVGNEIGAVRSDA